MVVLVEDAGWIGEVGEVASQSALRQAEPDGWLGGRRPLKLAERQDQMTNLQYTGNRLPLRMVFDAEAVGKDNNHLLLDTGSLSVGWF
jgi:hypothetical protein